MNKRLLFINIKITEKTNKIVSYTPEIKEPKKFDILIINNHIIYNNTIYPCITHSISKYISKHISLLDNPLSNKTLL